MKKFIPKSNLLQTVIECTLIIPLTGAMDWPLVLKLFLGIINLYGGIILFNNIKNLLNH